MLVSIGRRETPSDVVELFAECHQRIRSFVRVAEAISSSDAPAAEIREACSRVERYFREALPLHVIDEEQSLSPRLRGRSNELDEALAALDRQHAEHAPQIEALLEALAAVREATEDRELRVVLGDVARVLSHEFDEHLELEERVVFPAVRELFSESEKAAVLAELRARRAG